MRYLSFIIGIILILLAALANALGLDNDPGWGAGRWLLLSAGLALAIPSAGAMLFHSALLPAESRERMAAALAKLRGWAACALRAYPLTVALVIVAWLAITVYGFWLTSAGRFRYKHDSGFYSSLAEGFLRGELALPQMPDPVLLALPDPYNMAARDASGAKVLWDASLYHGRYYIYWGPIPALILAAGGLFTGQVGSNAALAFAFYAGLAGVTAMLLHLLRRRYYPRAPGVSIAIFLLAAALNLHLLWLAGRPVVYETAILSGQFFLFLGLLFWLIYIERGSLAWAILAGLSWGLAVGSRNTLVASAGVYSVFVLAHVLRNSAWNLRKLRWGTLAAVAVPLALCGAGLAWYNYARFGSLTETGVTYMLSLAVNPKQFFSPVYAPTNALMYLFYGFDLSESFPFFPFRITYNLQFPAWASRPPFKMFDREFYGLLPAAPVTWLLALAVPLLVWTVVRRGKASQEDETAGARRTERREIAAMIVLAGLAQFAVLMGFFYGGTRYGADFILPAVLVSALAAWEVDARLAGRPWLRAALWAAAAGLALATAVIGVFGSFYVPEGFIRRNNPAVYAALAKTWTPVGHYIAGAIRLILK